VYDTTVAAQHTVTVLGRRARKTPTVMAHCHFDELSTWTPADRAALAARIDAAVTLSPIPNPITGTPCRAVSTGHSAAGYPVREIRGRKRRLGRLRLALSGVRDAPELVADHLCRNRACVEPSHLRMVTQRLNVLTGSSPAAENAVKFACIRGHMLDGANLSILSNGERRCRACHRYRQRRRRAIERSGAIGQFGRVAA
jgi:hypothetical protein